MSEAGHNLLTIARVLKSNGTDGELVLGFRDIAPEDIDLEEPVFIFFDGLPVPFYIDSFTPRGNSKALVHLTDIDSYEDAEELVGQTVYAENILNGEDIQNDDFSMLVGWTLLDAEGKEVGTVSEFFDFPNNPCLQVDAGESSPIIPLHEDLVIAIDPESSVISMRIPDGLL